MYCLQLCGFSPTCFLIMCLLRLLDCYNVEYVLFDILRKYMIYSLESTRSFTFVHMLICKLVTNKFAGYMKKAPGQLYITQFVKSFISIRLPNFAWLVVVLSQIMCFSTPVLFFQPLSSPHNFDTLMTSLALENIFHSK